MFDFLPIRGVLDSCSTGSFIKEETYNLLRRSDSLEQKSEKIRVGTLGGEESQGSSLFKMGH